MNPDATFAAPTDDPAAPPPGRFGRFLELVQDLAETGLAIARSVHQTVQGLVGRRDPETTARITEHAHAFTLLISAVRWAVALHARLLREGEATLWPPADTTAAATGAAAAEAIDRAVDDDVPAPCAPLPPMPGDWPGDLPLDLLDDAEAAYAAASLDSRPVAEVIARIHENLRAAATILGRTEAVLCVEAMLCEMTALLIAGPEEAVPPVAGMRPAGDGFGDAPPARPGLADGCAAPDTG